MTSPRPRRSKFTPEKRATFLALLAEGHSAKFAAEKIRMSRRRMYYVRDEDETFAQAWTEALDAGTEALEDALWERAVKGTLRPVFQGGRRVGYVREYSDTAAIFLLNGRAPQKYRQRFEHTGRDGGPIQVGGAIIADGTEDQYVGALRLMRGAAAPAHGNGHRK